MTDLSKAIYVVYLVNSDSNDLEDIAVFTEHEAAKRYVAAQFDADDYRIWPQYLIDTKRKEIKND